MKACVAALREFPRVNASLSEDGDSLVYKKYIHLGVITSYSIHYTKLYEGADVTETTVPL